MCDRGGRFPNLQQFPGVTGTVYPNVPIPRKQRDKRILANIVMTRVYMVNLDQKDSSIENFILGCDEKGEGGLEGA